MLIQREIQEIIDKALSKRKLDTVELQTLLDLRTDSIENYALMAAANQLTREMAGNEGMISGQVGLNVESCSKNCEFCSFGAKHGLIQHGYRLNEEQVELQVKDWVKSGVNYISLMATADYEFEEFLKMSAVARKVMPSDMMLSANIGDFGREEARELKRLGYGRVYHVLRLGERQYTDIDPQTRINSIEAAASENLEIAFCIEPVGPEHTSQDIAKRIELSLDFKPTMMAAMRRIPIEGTEFAGSAVVPEIKMAQIMAVVRLAYAHHSATKTFYIHEPSLLGLLAGANLLCAETAANPREVNESGKKGRGFSVESCREVLYNAGYTLRQEPNYPGSWFKPLNGKE
ncbi:MAG: biotin synthase BioB [Desulfitobacteriaceae bacterium]